MVKTGVANYIPHMDFSIQNIIKSKTSKKGVHKNYNNWYLQYILKVCKTWTGDEINNNKSEGNMSYFSEETQFALFIVSNKVYNTPPILTSDRFITMEEDEGI